MFPNTEKGRREAWKRQWLADHAPIDPATGKPGEPYLMFTEEAREALRDPEAKAWIKRQMAAKTRLGTPLRPDVVKEYHRRFGAAGIDYRTMRIMRTETAVALAERQESIARNSDICTGMVDWVLQKGRDGWNCKCAEYAGKGPYDVDRLPGPVPLHPNCVKRGTKILTTRGYKKIEELKSGDPVISHDGTANQITAIYKTKYHGEMIRLNNGPWTTPEHGFLAGGSWRPAHSLNEGDNFTTVAGNRGNGGFGGNFIPRDSPSKRLKEGSFIVVLGDLARAGGMPLTAVYFNSELYIGICEVDIVFSYCESGDWTIAAIEEFYKKHSFVNAVTGTPRPAGRPAGKLGIGSLRPLNGLVRRINACLKPALIKPCPRLFYSGGGDADRSKLPIDTSAGNTKNFSDSVYRQAVFFKKSSRPFKANISFNTHAKVISKKHVQYNGDIYDLTVSSANSYVAAGAAVHNCNCQIRPRLKSKAEIDEEMRRRAAADDEIIRQWREQGN
jgi:hypothetical protein